MQWKLVLISISLGILKAFAEDNVTTESAVNVPSVKEITEVPLALNNNDTQLPETAFESKSLEIHVENSDIFNETSAFIDQHARYKPPITLVLNSGTTTHPTHPPTYYPSTTSRPKKYHPYPPYPYPPYPYPPHYPPYPPPHPTYTPTPPTTDKPYPPWIGFPPVFPPIFPPIGYPPGYGGYPGYPPGYGGYPGYPPYRPPYHHHHHHHHNYTDGTARSGADYDVVEYKTANSEINLSAEEIVEDEKKESNSFPFFSFLNFGRFK